MISATRSDNDKLVYQRAFFIYDRSVYRGGRIQLSVIARYAEMGSSECVCPSHPRSLMPIFRRFIMSIECNLRFGAHALRAVHV